MTLGKLEVNQTTMRNDIDVMQEKMDRLLEEAMVNIARKKDNLEIIIDARNITTQIGSSSLHIPEVTNIEFGLLV